MTDAHQRSPTVPLLWRTEKVRMHLRQTAVKVDQSNVVLMSYHRFIFIFKAGVAYQLYWHLK